MLWCRYAEDDVNALTDRRSSSQMHSSNIVDWIVVNMLEILDVNGQPDSLVSFIKWTKHKQHRPMITK